MAVLERSKGGAKSGSEKTSPGPDSGIDTFVVRSADLGAKIAVSKSNSPQQNAEYSRAVVKDAKSLSDYIIEKRTSTPLASKKAAAG